MEERRLGGNTKYTSIPRTYAIGGRSGDNMYYGAMDRFVGLLLLYYVGVIATPDKTSMD